MSPLLPARGGCRCGNVPVVACPISHKPNPGALFSRSYDDMIDLYTWPTPNGHKLHIMLEETGLEYRLHPVDISAGEQFQADFLKLSPNNKIPALTDSDGPDGEPISLFESGAMLVYLAEKSGKFLPGDRRSRMQVLQWLMFQMAHVGPMLGQAHHFLKYARERVPYAIERYRNEANRLYRVLDKRLDESDYLAGDEYTIADIATFPWLRKPADQGIDIAQYPNVKRWFDGIDQRPAVQRGLGVLQEQPVDIDDDKAWDILFGQGQYQQP